MSLSESGEKFLGFWSLIEYLNLEILGQCLKMVI